MNDRRYSIKHMYIEQNRAPLEKSIQTLQELAAMVKKLADSRGDYASAKRAKKILNAIISKNLPKDKISSYITEMQTLIAKLTNQKVFDKCKCR